MIKLALELEKLPADDFVRLARPAGFSAPEFWRRETPRARLRSITRSLPDRLAGIAYGLHAEMQGLEDTRAAALDAHAAALLDLSWLLRMAANAVWQQEVAADEAKEKERQARAAARKPKPAKGRKPAPVKVVGAKIATTRAKKVSA